MPKVPKLFLITILMIIGCKKDDPIIKEDNPILSNQKINFQPLTIGSWWVYEWNTVTNTGDVTFRNLDTLFIAGDTVINGQKFYNRKGKSMGSTVNQFLRDSSGYLVNHKGTILCSSHNFTDTLFTYNSGNVYEYRMMAHKDTLITVPRGTFKSSAYKYFFSASYQDTTIKSNCYDFYSANKGIVKRSHTYFPNGHKDIQELVNYNIALE
jgi:hypothetical protein